MKSISSLQSIPLFAKSTPVPGRTGQPLVLPEQGQLLKALVLEAKAEHTFLLQIGDNRLLAQSEAALLPGQNLQLQLVDTSPRVELKIVNDTLQQFFGQPLTLVGNTIDINTLFTLLQQPQSLLEELSLHSRQTLESFFSLQQNVPFPTESGGSTLKQLVDQLGLSLEHLLARGEGRNGAFSLKAALLELSSNFKIGSQIHDSASRTLATLEFFQLAQLHNDSNQQFILPLPLSFIEQGFLLVEQRKQEEEGGGGDYEHQEYRFSLFLKMSELGNLRIDFFHSPEGLFIRFHTDSQEKSDFLAGLSDNLRESLTESPILGISFAADAPDPASELVRRIIPEGRPMLDTLA